MLRPLPIVGALAVQTTRRVDARGWFVRAWSQAEPLGLPTAWAQVNQSGTARAGTVRGLHWQAPPHAEAKLIWVVRGAIYDVIVDVRPGSATWGQWHGERLAAGDGAQIYVPEGCAHGFQALDDDTEVLYLSTQPWCPEAERGIRPDDPAIGVRWPLPLGEVSEKDRGWPDFAATQHRG